MLLIPEIQKVVILVPRTGTGSLYRAVKQKYPRTLMPYRHMEADGVPAGYDRWQKVGVVRHPVQRLWSLYKFLNGPLQQGGHSDRYKAEQRVSDRMTFNEWLVHNRTVFTDPYELYDGMAYHPFYTVRHALPENRKSQFIYLRPDLGTRIYQYDDVKLYVDLRLDWRALCAERQNVTGKSALPPLSAEAKDYIERIFRWDLEITS